MKTRYHKNPLHKWTVNDIVDIDAVSIAYAYCAAVFPDKAVRAALQKFEGAADDRDLRASASRGAHRLAERPADGSCAGSVGAPRDPAADRLRVRFDTDLSTPN